MWNSGRFHQTSATLFKEKHAGASEIFRLKKDLTIMKKLMTAAMGLSLLTGTVVFAQNTATTSTMSKKKSKKKKSTSTDTMSAPKK
jgi:glutamate-1-semialdehyde aminotransferase